MHVIYLAVWMAAENSPLATAVLLGFENQLDAVATSGRSLAHGEVKTPAGSLQPAP